jgi:hypothetical protein
MGFSQHGTFEVYVEGRVLYERVAYPINMETFGRMVADTWGIMRSLIDAGPWAMIVTIYGEPLPPSDVAQGYKELGKDPTRNKNRACLAYVLTDDLPCVEISRDFYRSICAQALVPQAVFATREAAETWVAERLAEADANL